jgi:NitT/TauT family transport system permease protein
MSDVAASSPVRRNALIGVRVGSIALVLIAWQWYGSKPDTFAVAPFTEVLESLWSGFAEGDFGPALRGTLWSFLVGYSISAVLGVLIGLAIATTAWGRNAIEPIVDIVYMTPMSLLIPIIGIYTGLGFQGRVLFIVLWSIVEIIVNTAEGVRSTPAQRIELARSFNSSRTMLYTKVIFPSALPQTMAGLRLGVGRALRGAVTAELLLAAANLGRLSLFAGSTFDIPRLMAVILLVMLTGLLLMRGASAIERRALRYQEGG